MNSKHLATFALAGILAVGAAHAGNRADVQWSVTLGSPQLGVIVGSPVYAPRVYAQPVYAQPIYVVPQGHGVYRTGWRDDDRDGIPNRYDRVYNPRWDRDGDGIPNRYDRRDDSRSTWRGDDRGDHRGDHRDEQRPVPRSDNYGSPRPGR